MPEKTTIRFTRADLTILDALQLKTGIVSRSEVVRRAIRVFAELEGVSPEPERFRKRVK